MKKKETVEQRAVKIAAVVMQAAGLCRYESMAKCSHAGEEKITCERCIRAWLLQKAREELRAERNI